MGKAGGEEEQRLEGCVGDEMQEGDARIARADGHEHQPILGRGGGGEQALGMGLEQRDDAARKRGRGTHGDDRARQTRHRGEEGLKAEQDEGPGGDHGRGMKQRRDRGGPRHRSEEPRRERDLAGFRGGG